MSRRQAGNRYERKCHHRRQQAVLQHRQSNRYFKNRFHRKMRTSERKQLHHTALNDTWDIYTPDIKFAWDKSVYSYPRNYSWQGRRNPSVPKLSPEEIRRLPGRHRHYYIDNERSYNNIANFLLPRRPFRIKKYIDYDRAILTIKSLYFSVKKSGLEKSNEHLSDLERCFILDCSAYTLLDSWWEDCPYRRKVVEELQKLGYDCWTTNKRLSLPLSKR